MPPHITTEQVGSRSRIRSELLGVPSAGLHLDPDGITVVVADQWTDAELTETGPVSLVLHHIASVVFISMRLDNNLVLTLPWTRMTDSSTWQSIPRTGTNGHLTVRIQYVNCFTGIIERIRPIRLDEGFSTDLLRILHDCSQGETTSDHFRRISHLIFELHPSWMFLTGTALLHGVGVD